ncbi:hypothetical protein HDU67_001632 [Dinochytrium kinnereticum]|nr:hypothetical protein HDU67_001632 [Dinochytrium kinnereticum]
MTPALWNRVAGDAYSQPPAAAPQYQQQPQQPQQQVPAYEVKPGHNQPASDVKPEQGYGQPQQQQQEPPKEEAKPGFFQNPMVQLAAGLVGAATVAGIGGAVAYKFHKDHNDDQKREAWLNAANVTSQTDIASGKKVYWVTTEGKFMPPNAIQCGTDGDGAPLFASRVYHDSGVVVGKANPKMGCNIGYGNKEICVSREKFQVLCGESNAIKWVEMNGTCALGDAKPILAGQEKDGQPLYVAQTFFNNSVQVGKVGPHMKNGINFPYGGKEATSMSYKVACLA